MQIAVVAQRLPFVQVPVRYLPRVGVSSVTGALSKTIPLGLEMIGIVLRERLRTLGTRPARGRTLGADARQDGWRPQAPQHVVHSEQSDVSALNRG